MESRALILWFAAVCLWGHGCDMMPWASVAGGADSSWTQQVQKTLTNDPVLAFEHPCPHLQLVISPTRPWARGSWGISSQALLLREGHTLCWAEGQTASLMSYLLGPQWAMTRPRLCTGLWWPPGQGEAGGAAQQLLHHTSWDTQLLRALRWRMGCWVWHAANFVVRFKSYLAQVKAFLPPPLPGQCPLGRLLSLN